ncbi:MAG: CPBP family intramembrane metalloprotease [Clostridia bacterium]|nr:CPBP family intramembrane metalloprotease [Clostridia bacterium]
MGDYKKNQIENSPSNVGLLYVIMIASSLILSVSCGFITQPLAKTNGFLYYLINGLSSSISLFAVLSVYFNFVKKCTPFKRLFSLNKTNPLNYVIAFLIAGGMMFGLGFINGLFADLFNIPAPETTITDFVHGNALAYVLSVIVFALLPAVFEECFFRGAIANAIDNEKIVPATITVALIFALYHFSFTQLIYQAIYGAILYLLVKKGGSIFPCMIAHFLNNFTILTLEFIGVEINLYSPWCICFGILSLAISIALLFIVNGKKNSEKVSTEKDSKKDTKGEKQGLKFWVPYGILGALVCIAVAILGVI